MNVVEIINYLEQESIKIGLSNNQIKLKGDKEKITKDIIELIRKNKDELIKFITAYNSENTFSNIRKSEKKEYYPLTSPQTRMYLVQKISNDVAYNMPFSFPMPESIGKEEIEQIILKIINYHHILRSSYIMKGDSIVQIINEDVKFRLDEIRINEEGFENIYQRFLKPFDLTQAPLIRGSLVRITDSNKSILLIDMHHIICDGISHKILKDNFYKLYKNEKLPVNRLQYLDFAVWQDNKHYKEKIKKFENYWIDKFSGELPLLNLPRDFSRNEITNYNGATVTYLINEKETESIKTYITQKGFTLYMFTLAVFKILLSKLTGQSDIIVGTTNEARPHIDMDSAVGMFVNTLPIRSYPDSAKRIQDYLGEIKKLTIEAFENKEYPFEYLLEKITLTKDKSRNSLFDVLFVLQNEEQASSKIETSNKHFRGYSKFDLRLCVNNCGKQLLLNFEYSTNLFNSETIDRLGIFYKTLINRLLNNDKITIGEIDLISVEEKKQLIYEYNNTNYDYPIQKTIIELFNEQVKKTPSCIALEMNNNSMTYQEVAELSDKFAQFLLYNNINKGELIGIMLDRSMDAVISILAVLKTNCAFLPLDVDIPEKRLHIIIEDSNLSTIITSENVTIERTHLIGHNLNNLSSNSYLSKVTQILTTDQFYENIHNYELNILNKDLSKGQPDDIAYCIYTSGTTGRPKGVLVNNKNLVNYIWSAVQLYCFDEECNFPLYTSLTFDLTITSIFTPLISGNKLIIYKMIDIDNIINDDKSSVIKLTPSHLRLIRDNQSLERKIRNSKIKRFIVGGEQLETKLVQDITDKFNSIDIYNEYGPTEATVGCIVHKYDKEKDKKTNVPVGKPFPNTKAYILNYYMQPVPKGIVGELYIGGICVTEGYLNMPLLTSKKFIPNPFSKNEYLYYTGDLARMLPSNSIEFIGRNDSQVKIRGYRIEITEIESVLKSLDRISDAIVVVKKDNLSMQFLCAYYVTDYEIDAYDIKDDLKEIIPEYMIPQYFKEIEAIPLNKNGKVEKTALPDIEYNSLIEFVPPSTEIEIKLASIWSNVLGMPYDKIGIDADFFELGGHSVKANILVNQINNSFKIRMLISDIFKGSSMREMAILIDLILDTKEPLSPNKTKSKRVVI